MADRADVSDGKRFVEIFNACADRMLKSRSIEDERGQRTLKPTVIIGLGGTGCEIGARLKKALDSYYRQLDIAAGMYQYVMLDTEPLCGQQEEMIMETFAEGQQYFFLGGFNPSDYIVANIHRLDESDLRRWWDPDYRVGAVPIEQGCKSCRQLGRLCLYRSRDMVAMAIHGAATRARDLNEELVRKANLPQLPQNLGLTFYIITGCCGGTGSGMFLDVCYLVRHVARDLGVGRPVVRAVILMPTLYVDRALRSHKEWGPHYQANAYAFFTELHHFILNGRDWHDHCMDADRLKARGIQPPSPLEGWKPADRFYLMDNLVAGSVLTDLRHVFTLSADSLFHLIATPCGVNEEGRALVGIDHLLDGRKDGKARAFSSLGVAYTIYPAKTIARAATAGHLAGILRERYLQPLATEGEKKPALAAASQLFAEENAKDLNAALVADAIRAKAEQFARSLPSATDIEHKSQKRQGGKELGHYGAMERAQRTFDALLTQAEAAIEAAYKEAKDAGLQRVDELIRKGVNTCFGGTSVRYGEVVLARLLELAKAGAPPAPTHKGGSPTELSRAVAYGEAAEDAKKEVQRLESDVIPNFFQRKAIRNQVRTFATALQNHFAAALAEIAAGYAHDYLGEVLARLRAGQERCERACLELTLLLTALGGKDATDCDPERDESYLVATAQLVPRGGVDAAAEALRGRLAPKLAEGAKALLTRLAERDSFWAMGSKAPADREAARYAAVETMVNWVLGTEDVSREMALAVHEVVIKNIGKERFKNEVLEVMLRLSDPSWELALEPAAMKPDDIPILFSLARPDAFPKGVLPGRLLDEENFGNGKPMDPRRVLVLQSQHAAPLHGVVGMSVLKRSYREWLANKERDSLPLHLSREWKKGAGLVDVFPPQVVTTLRNPETITYFALGHFSEWLVAVKKHEATSRLVENWPQHGYIYSRGKYKYYAVALEKTASGGIRRAGHKDKWLNEKGGRTAALGNFDDPCVASGKLFIQALEDRIASADLKSLMGEYLEYLQRQIEGTAIHELRNLLVAEQDAVKEYMERSEEA